MTMYPRKLGATLCAAFSAFVWSSATEAGPMPPVARETTVDCAGGDSINDAIARGFSVITVSGVCDENVVIGVDGIALLSDPANPGAISPALGLPLHIRSADGISVNSLEIESQNSQNAVLVSHAQASFTEVDVIGGASYALEARSNASVDFNGGSIAGATNGAQASGSSSLSLNNTEVSGIDTLAVTSSGGSNVQVSGSVIDGTNSDLNSSGFTVAIGSSASIMSGTTISGFRVSGVVTIGGAVRIASSEVSGNGGGTSFYPGQGGVIVGAGGSIQIGASSEVSNNTGTGVLLVDGSGGVCGGSSEISGNTTDLDVDGSSGFDQGTCTLTPP